MKKAEVEKRVDEYFDSKTGEEIYARWLRHFGNCLVGLKFDERRKESLTYMGIKYRLVSVDGEPRVVTCDFKPDRMNISIENGIITKVEFG